MSDGLGVGGGPGGIGAETDDMRLKARMLETVNGSLEDIAGHARRAAFSGALVRTAIFSPGSAAHAEASLVQAAAVVSGLTVRLEAAVLLLRTRATMFELADAGASVVDLIASLEAAPLAVPLAVLGFLDPAAARRILDEFPQLTDLVTGGITDWAVILGLGLPRNYEDVLRGLEGAATVLGRRPDGHIVVRPQAPRDAHYGNLADVLRSIDAMEPGRAGQHDHDTVRIVKLDHGDDPPTWVVEIPGMDSRAGDSNPGNGVENLSAMTRRRDALTNAVVEAMGRAQIGPGERVLLSGHSQGGIVAMRIAENSAVRAKYAITDVVTAGSPVSRLHPPPDVHVLSIEHRSDPVPRLDTQPNPDRPNWTTITRDVSAESTVRHDAMEAHRASVYTGTAALIDDDADPRIAEARARLDAFLSGRAQEQDFLLSR